MKKNIFVEASERYRDFQERGFIPEGVKYVYREFVKEVSAERNQGVFEGRYSASSYSSKYGFTIEYFTGITLNEVKERYYGIILERYKSELLDIFDKNDFIRMSEQYGVREYNFDINEVLVISDFDGLISVAKKAMRVAPYFFRNINGRNRTTESSMMENYFDEFQLDLRRFIREVQMFMDENNL